MRDRRCWQMARDNDSFFHAVALVLNLAGREKGITNVQLRSSISNMMKFALQHSNHRAAQCEMTSDRAANTAKQGRAGAAEMFALSRNYMCVVVVTLFNDDRSGLQHNIYDWSLGPVPRDHLLLQEGERPIRLAVNNDHWDAVIVIDEVNVTPAEHQDAMPNVNTNLPDIIDDAAMLSDYTEAGAAVAHSTTLRCPLRTIYCLHTVEIQCIMQYLDAMSIITMAMTSRHMVVIASGKLAWLHAATAITLNLRGNPLPTVTLSIVQQYPGVKSCYFSELGNDYVEMFRGCRNITLLKVDFYPPPGQSLPQTFAILASPSLRRSVRHLDIRLEWTEHHQSLVLRSLPNLESLTSLCLRRIDRYVSPSLMLLISPAIPRTVTSFACEIEVGNTFGVSSTCLSVGCMIALHQRIYRLRIILVLCLNWDLGLKEAREVHNSLCSLLNLRAAATIDLHDGEDDQEKSDDARRSRLVDRSALDADWYKRRSTE